MPDRLRLDDQLCFALYAATNAVTRAYRPLLSSLGLTYPQYLVMLALWQHGPATVGEVAVRLDLDSHAVTPLVDRLARAGLVRKRRDVRDRRRVHVELTPAGRGLESDAALAQAQVVCRTGLAPDDLAALRDRLRALARTTSDPVLSGATAPEPRPETHPTEGVAS